MKPSFKKIAWIALFSVAVAYPLYACSEYDLLEEQIASPQMITKTATVSGNYSSRTTWGGELPPGPSDVALIKPGVTVTIYDKRAVAKTIIVSGSVSTTGSGTQTRIESISHGTLRFNPHSNTQLAVETLLVGDYGRLIVGGFGGNEGSPIGAGVKANIVIVSTTGTQPVGDDQLMARGIITDCDAVVRMNSAAPRAPFVELRDSVNPSNSKYAINLTDAFAPTNWSVGDQILIPSTIFTREWASKMRAESQGFGSGTEAMQNEVRLLTSVGNASITVDSALFYEHNRAVGPGDSSQDSERIHINAANLTRNIVIQTDPNHGSLVDDTHIPARGHVMFMGGDVKINGVCFQDLGRTNKREIVSDPLLKNEWNAPLLNVDGNYQPVFEYLVVNGVKTQILNPTANPRARYACHFHENIENFKENHAEFPLIYPAAPKAVVSNSVVRGTPGWGFVNHSSWVDFKDNVSFDFRGAGFSAEDGDELGTFSGNIAIGGLGNGEFPRIETVSGNRPRTNQGDMGFTGEGFWAQGPDVKFENNIAAGCKGCGFFIWGAGRLLPSFAAAETGTNEIYLGAFSGRPLGRDGVGGDSEPGVGDETSANPNARGVKARGWDYTTRTQAQKDQKINSNPEGLFEIQAIVIADIPPQDFKNNTAYGCFMGFKTRFANNGSQPIYNLRNFDYMIQMFPERGPSQLGRFTVSGCTFWNNLIGMQTSYTLNQDIEDVYIAAEKTCSTASQAPGPSDAGLGYIGLIVNQSTDGIFFKSGVKVKNYTFSAIVWPNGNGYTNIEQVNCNGMFLMQEKGSFNYDNFDTIEASNNIPDYGQR